ncbi:hypothetical protein FOH10_01495 [Nocardia otitidiscaviarum]|uniref:Uncharacterized protein n=1 Tax=Nocardia otitidiscaviarum TaxID=1823 RepID=A0A516NFD6_9NOCA|nr:hypothetical protein [Nocardia otitidiscaviarum]MCP9622934.1 hypothetical protein [Nocardia otitidiscaviarum]QDP77618.1 hypothetical protein FOH10_01495 [Nocardia otitidiscaviarum]
MSERNLPPELRALLRKPLAESGTTEPDVKNQNQQSGKKGASAAEPSWAGEISYEERVFLHENSRIAAEPPW